MTPLTTHFKANIFIRVVAISLFLLVAPAITYLQTLDHGFLHFDDNEYLTNNQYVKSGLTGESIAWAFTESHSSNWHPVTWMSHMLDFELYELNAPGHHLTSLLFHIANTLILFWVLLKMTGAVWRSGMVAALFALHPLNVESVVWIAERKNVLSTFFWFLTFWAYARYVEKPTVKKYGLVALFLALGLMSKPMLVTLPFVLLLLDFWPLKRWGDTTTPKQPDIKMETISKLVSEKMPLFLLVAGSIIITYIAQKAGGAVRSVESFPLQERFMNAFVSYLSYLQKMLWPSELSIFYPHPGSTLPIWKALLCAGALIGISFMVVKQLRKAPYLAVGWFWYLGTLVPVIGIVQVGEQAMADRYMYVPLIGIFIAMVWGLSDWAKNGKQKLLPISVGIIIPLLMALTWNQVSHWKNNISLFEHAIAVTNNKYPGIASTHAYLGNAYHREGKLSLAISQFKKSLELKPEHLYSYNNLSAALAEQGNLEEALLYAQNLVTLKSNYKPGVITLAYILEQLGRLDEAQSTYRKALELDSNSYENHLNLANVLYKTGNLAEAISFYKNAIDRNPRLVEAHYNLGNAFGQQGNLENAKDAFEKAIRLDDKLPLPHYGLGIVYQQTNQYSRAIKAFEQALILNPQLTQAHHSLAKIYNELGEEQKALLHIRLAKEISGQNKTQTK
jgi:protein O-mannosyl-transferase